MKVQVHEDWSSLSGEAWNRLAARSPVATVFQSWEWHRAWWNAFGERGRLALVCVRQEETLRAVAPLWIDAGRVLRFVGDGHADYGDVLCAAEDAAAAEALWLAIVGLGDWRSAAWRHLPAEAWAARWARRGGRTVPSPPIPCPRLDLRDREAARGMATKKSLRRHANHFARQPGFEVAHSSSRRDIEPWLEAFFDQHVQRWAGTPTPSAFANTSERIFYRNLVAGFDGTGRLWFTRLCTAEGPVAFHLGFECEGTFTWYKPSFAISLARRSPGEALIKALLDRAIARELATFDFTVGGEAFKLRFATSIPEACSYRLYRGRVDHWRAAAVDGLKGVSRRMGLTAAIRRRRGAIAGPVGR